MFLATTSISDFWDKKQEILFLGPWCIPFYKRNELNGLRYEVMKSPWEDDKRYEEAMKYVEDFRERLIEKLAGYLNKVHEVDYSVRYWKILMGYWPIYGVSHFYDKYICLKDAFENYPELQTRLLKQNYQIHERILEALNDRDLLDLKDYSFLIKNLGYNFPSKSFKPNTEFIKILMKLSLQKINPEAPKKVNYIDYLKFGDPEEMAPVLLSGLYCDDDIQRMLYDKIKPSIILENMDDHWLANPNIFKTLHNIFIYNKKRKDLGKLEFENEFERLFIKALPYKFPTLFLEKYKDTKEKIKKRYPKFPKIIISATRSNTLSFFIADAMRNGTKVYNIQHATPYSTYKFLPLFNYEFSICDKFLSWGWADEKDVRFKNIPSLKNSFIYNKYSKESLKQDQILYLATRTFSRIDEFWSSLCPPAWEEYCEWQYRFFSLLPKDIRSLMFYRSKIHQLEGWDNELAIKFPEIKFDESDFAKGNTFYDRLDKCRVVIVDACMQVFAECLSSNKPTILFWNPNFWNVKEEVERHFDNFRKAGFLYNSPEQAATKLVEIYNDPWKWWENDDVQNAREAFLEKFVLSREDWLEQWDKSIKEELVILNKLGK
ncbi:MAG: LIC12162 family protein [Nanoarchaeota archaeon]